MKRLLTLAMSLLSLSVAAQTVASMNELNAVQKAAATNVKLTGKLSTGGNSDFRQLRDLCYQLRSIDLGSADCEAIPNNAFHSRHVLEQVVLPENVRSIGSQAFFACTALNSIELPKTLTRVGDAAFSGCTKLRDITINGTPTLGEFAFARLSGLRTLRVNSAVPPVASASTFEGIDQGEQLLMKIAMSTTSIDGAKKNLAAEVPDWNFAATRRAAHDEWNAYLQRIDVEGTLDQKKNYYTSFYHALIQPNQIADVDGMYRNAADQIVKAETGKFYSTFSCWDTYRAAHPFYTIVMPDRVDGMVSSLVEQAEVQGFLPIWGLWGKENYCMVGNHAVSIVAEAYHKGFRGFDAERAFQAVKKTQTVSHKLKSDWETYMKYGYLPTDLIKTESVSSSLESMYDDYCAADMARLMGKKDDAQYFTRRAQFYKNLFDKSTGFMRPRLADGSWRTPFDPSNLAHSESIGGDYTEGNAWQYTWQVQHDVPGLIKLFGGNKPFMKKLDQFFSLKLESNIADVTGLIGQYAHGNEPSHHVAYLYTLAGRPERTQELIREIFDTQYRPTVDGLCGNDDCGQMSAWYMLSAMGFYPVNPVSGQYVFGAPQMKKITVHLQNGKTFTVIADGLSAENKYVESITLNGKKLKTNYINHADIMKGGTLVYKMRK